jgi:hypothetical protein
MFFANDYLIAVLAQERLADLRRQAEIERLLRELSRSQSDGSSRFWRKVSSYLGGLLMTTGAWLLSYGQPQVTPFTHNNSPAGLLVGK